MKNAVGRCPKCSSFIKVDLSAPEVRCPECGALLKKSSKSVAEVEAERERKRRLAAGLPEVEEQVAPVEEPIPETPVAEEPISAETAEAAETHAEEVAEAPAEETMSEEEAMALAASFDETPDEPEAMPAEDAAPEAERETQKEEETPAAPAAEEVNPDEISDEELALMDEDIPEDIAKEEPTVYGSVSLEDDVPEEKAEEAETEEAAEDPQEEEELGEGMKDLSSEDDNETPDLEVEAAPETEEAPREEVGLPDTSSSETEATNDLFSDSPLEEAQPEEKTEAPAPEAAPEADIALTDEAPVAEETAPVDEAPETPAEEIVEEAAPIEEAAPEAPAPREESAVEDENALEVPAEIAEEAPADIDIKEEIPDEKPAEAPVETAEAPAPEEPSTVAEAAAEEPAPVAEEAPAVQETSAEETKEEASLTQEEAPEAEETSDKDDEYSLDTALASQEAPAPAPETPAEKEPEAPAPIEEAPAEDAPAYSEEDFAAAGEIDVRSFALKKRTAKSAHEVARALRVAEEKQQKQKETSTKENLFSRPVAAVIFALSLIFVLFDFAYGLFVRNAAAASFFLAGNYAGAVYSDAPALISVLPESVIGTILSKLPVFGGDLFLTFITAIYYGLIAVIAALGISGKRCRAGSVVLLLADIVIAFFRLWTLNGGAFFFIPYDGLPEILASYGAYILAGGYALLLIAAALYIASFARAKEPFAFSFKAGIPALIYAALVLLGGAALIVLPIVKADFALSDAILGYALMGVFGLSVLTTFVGVQERDLSRSANGYLAAYLLASASCLLLAATLLPLFSVGTIPSLVRFVGVLPSALLVGAAGFSVANIRK